MATRARTRVTALLVVAAVLVGIAGVSAVRAGSPSELPPIPPQELLASSLEALAAPFSISGDVTTRFETGLPDISGTLGSTGTGLGGLATALLGTQHYKVWRSDDGVRVARVSDLSEQVIVANRDEAWYWDSNGMTAGRLDLAALSQRAASRARVGRDDDAHARRPHELDRLGALGAVAVRPRVGRHERRGRRPTRLRPGPHARAGTHADRARDGGDRRRDPAPAPVLGDAEGLGRSRRRDRVRHRLVRPDRRRDVRLHAARGRAGLRGHASRRERIRRRGAEVESGPATCARSGRGSPRGSRCV